MTTFTNQIHELAKPLWLRSAHHPFIKQLTSGDLPLSTFRYYLLQDRYYLSEFGKLHDKIADQLTDKTAIQFLRDGAEGLKNGEIAVRKGFFTQLNISKEEIALTPIAPTAYNYVNHMYAALYQGTPQRAIAALLPCYWLYNEIGQSLIRQGSPVGLYQQWIETYDSDGYTDSVNKMIQLTNRAAEQVDDAERQEMTTAFIRSSAYELGYWGMSLRHENWDSL
ncbi:thiaminase II [Lentilactobacillus hilgardii]|uniref:Aminopyrimidine aminohydrolase n=1 Tax=Lentilactobacillus hilgardii (strain ATCC 8290 / DSM 20176 / CCUG 30140 / JCM 1155 / KCTC 3500 / NBRC 15886 / NCIMB 8040 / NRRL B-1843 / 9) TaxID=1423757 RepID=C0XJS4_LENH9|nr:thiaminase II [Lentilactobacillus hilgardii]EEI20533.1 TENA/THI-4 family protein [Lentilactobacillus buchneri ATCC 11577]EEI24403.1 TENA/THI-4 family protein [Lentilactobacillus hilgardii DSM 20176 = ATCC 8290]KRK58956.1 thiaminase [Lentilactobacillus hilgardii DSM 20176 = ATCC 8290]MCT3396288.1 thiaminase II [Lentilactobacillus hilgardii]QEU37829.1 thiaminase II [Lentilactobacillus hilgardii]